jgi:hypothetical protein
MIDYMQETVGIDEIHCCQSVPDAKERQNTYAEHFVLEGFCVETEVCN